MKDSNKIIIRYGTIAVAILSIAIVFTDPVHGSLPFNREFDDQRSIRHVP